jgi:hypothetical protein
MTAIHPSSFIPLWSGIVAVFERKPCTTGGCVENPTTWKAEDSTKRSSVWELCPKQPIACPNAGPVEHCILAKSSLRSGATPASP